jgi:hypothetical protein
VQPRTDWLHLTVFALALGGIALGVVAAIGLLLLAVMGLALGNSADALTMGSAAASLGTASLLGAPMAYWAGRTLLRGEAPQRSLPARGWAVLALVFPVAIAAGYLASDQGVVPGVLGPAAQVLAAGIPVALLALWVRRRSLPVTPTRAWGHFLMGLWLAPILALALEGVLLLGTVVVLLVGLAAQPGMADLITRLGTNPAQAPQAMQEALSTLALNPWTIVCVLGFISVFVPLLEEGIKALGVVPFLRLRLSPSEAFLGGVLSGLGYALFEALFLPQPGSGWVETMLARIGATLMHALTAGLTGWALGEAVVRRKPFPALAAYPVAVVIHGAWNACAVAVGLAGIAAEAAGSQLTEPPYVVVAAAGVLILAALTLGATVAIPRIARRLMPRPVPDPAAPELPAL